MDETEAIQKRIQLLERQKDQIRERALSKIGLGLGRHP